MDLILTVYSLLVTLLPSGLISTNLIFYSQRVFVCFLWISEQKKNSFVISKIKWLVFTTEMESVYCRVRTRSLTKTDHFCPERVTRVIYLVLGKYDCST